MKGLKDVWVILIVISFILSASAVLSYAQPKIPREKIPSNIPSDVREQIERLYSADPKERVNGAVRLGNMGEKAAAAIPFLMAILGDETGLGSYTSSPGTEAGKALVSIGKSAVEPLIAALKDEDSYVREVAVEVLGKIKDPRAVEPLIVALEDENSSVREYAAKALGEIKDPRAVEPAPQAAGKETKPKPEKLLPQFKEELQGANPVRVRNPNDFAVATGIRAGEKGRTSMSPPMA